jgi:hypothetical protein
VSDATEVIAVAIGGTYRSRDGGAWAVWRRADDPTEVAPVAILPEGGSLFVADAAGLFDGRDRRLGDLPTTAPAALACRRTASGIEVAVTDGTSIWMGTLDAVGGSEVVWSELSAAPPGTVRALAFGSPGSRDASALVAGTLDVEGRGAVWMRQGDTWLVLADGPSSVVALAAVPGPRGLFAALGNALYRPASVGESLLAAEYPGGRSGASITHVAAVRHDDELVIAVLTASGIAVSRSGGLDWLRIDPPDGPPATAIDLRTEPRLELLVAHLGGSVSAIEIPTE